MTGVLLKLSTPSSWIGSSLDHVATTKKLLQWSFGNGLRPPPEKVLCALFSAPMCEYCIHSCQTKKCRCENPLNKCNWYSNIYYLWRLYLITQDGPPVPDLGLSLPHARWRWPVSTEASLHLHSQCSYGQHSGPCRCQHYRGQCYPLGPCFTGCYCYKEPIVCRHLPVLCTTTELVNCGNRCL